MNFLAHCTLADASCSGVQTASPKACDALIAGGVLADFCKGVLPDTLPNELAMGIRLHRRIDAYSNQHPGIQRSCQRFTKQLRRFAPIFVDVFADHALANHWGDFHTQPLQPFIQRCYTILQRSALPTGYGDDRTNEFIDYMVETDLMGQYRSWEGVRKGVYGVCRRLRQQQLQNPALEEMGKLAEALSEDFVSYYPDLIGEACRFIGEEFATDASAAR